jgi:hypothetical protein
MPYSAQVRVQQEKQEDSNPRIGSFKIREDRQRNCPAPRRPVTLNDEWTSRHQEDPRPSRMSGQAGIKDADVASKIWGKNIPASIRKTTRSKSTPVARNYVNVRRELLQLHRKSV